MNTKEIVLEALYEAKRSLTLAELADHVIMLRRNKVLISLIDLQKEGKIASFNYRYGTPVIIIADLMAEISRLQNNNNILQEQLNALNRRIVEKLKEEGKRRE